VAQEPANHEIELSRPRNWRGVWQLPTLVAAGGMLAAGLAAVVLGRADPDLNAMIERTETLIARQQYQLALDQLNHALRPWYDGGSLSPEQMRRFHLLRARAVYLGQKELGLDLVENARSIAEEYAAAARQSPLDEPRDIYFLADVHVTLNLYERAIELARTLPAGRGDEAWLADARPRIYRRIIQRFIRDEQSDAEVALRLLEEFLRDGDPSAADRAWGLARQTEILTRRGDLEAAIGRLLRSMPALLPDIGPEQAGELYLLLGSAYAESGAMNEAGRQLRAGLEFLLDTDDRWARATVLLARVDEATGQPPEEARAEARQKYQSVAIRFEHSEERLPALLGLAEVEAAMGHMDASLHAYGRLVDALLEGAVHPDAARSTVTASLLARWRGSFDTGAAEPALRYAQLAERLMRPAAAAPEVLLAEARSHRALADAPLGELPEAGAAGEGRAQRIADLDPATRLAVRGHLTSAGRSYKLHADTVGIADNIAFGESLWSAAESHDLAGDLDASIPLFADYIRYFPGDPRRAEARYRLGRAYQARGDYLLAAEHFRALIADARAGRGAPPESAAGVGPYADLSMVPLAQVLLLDEDESNDTEAESLLLEVVSGRVGGTATAQFRDALLELGRYLSRRGQYAAAIQRLEEAVARFPDHPRGHLASFALAEAHRQDALAIRQTLQEAMPDHRRHMLQQARLERLRRAEDLYEQVRRTLELKETRRRTRLEELQLRNSYFYLGDCAFELGEYEAAIRRYDAARERYPEDPAALVAMVQIVNAYVEQGDLARAATANERARRFYQSLPATAWNDPDLPMSRQDWQRWLDSMTALRPVRTAGVEER
jgi:TolA-binding protein